MDSLLEPRGGLGSKEPPASPLNLAGAGAHSLLGGSATPQNVHAASSCLLEKAAPGREPPETGGEGSPSLEMSEPDAPLLLEPPELPSGEWREPRHLGDVSSPLAAAAEEGEMSQEAEERPEGSPAQPPGDDHPLEGSPAPEVPDPNFLESADMSDPATGTEPGLHECHGLPLPLGLLPPASGSALPGNVPISWPKDQEEEAGISLASALKELHQLLVVSSKHDFRRGGARQEGSCPSLEVPPKEPATAEEDSPLSRLEAGTEMLEEPHLAGGQQEAAQGASGCSDSVPASPLMAWPLPQAEECLRMPAQLVCSGPHPDSTAVGQSPLASFGPQESCTTRDSCSPSPEEAGDSSGKHPEPSSFPPGDSEPRSPHPALAANLDQLVGAGFTPQEAGEALEHAGGNADLALLILLARNIVVPT